jgi:hypothetical protein
MTNPEIIDLNIVQGQFVNTKLLNEILVDMDESSQPFSFFEMREALGKDILYFYVQNWINDLKEGNG